MSLYLVCWQRPPLRSLIPLILPVVLLLQLLFATPAISDADHLLLCEVALDGVEFIEIYNPTATPESLSDYYLSDDQEYGLLAGADPDPDTEGPGPWIHSSDFIARFPDNTTIAAGGKVIVAFDATAFEALYGMLPGVQVFEIVDSDGDSGNDMREPYGLIGGSPSLTPGGEMIALFYWNGTSDLVEDADLVLVGRPSDTNNLEDKSEDGQYAGGVDGPDEDSEREFYLTDSLGMPKPGDTPGAGESAKRVLTEEPDETNSDGNGRTGHDETSEDITLTWDSTWKSDSHLIAPNPGVCCVTADCYYDEVVGSDWPTLRQTLHEAIHDHRWIPYSDSNRPYDVWRVLEAVQTHPQNDQKIIELYHNQTYDKVTDRWPTPGGYSREHAWPSSCGFSDEDDTDNFPYTDCHHLFLANQPDFNASRQEKPYGYCDAGCEERPTLYNPGNGWGGGSGSYPGNSNWKREAPDPGIWETWWARRGDVARALFYLDVRYEGHNHVRTGDPQPNLVLTDTISQIGCTDDDLFHALAHMGLLSDLIRWHLEDPVDDDERLKNDVVHRVQVNRSPFVDHPEWVPCAVLDPPLCHAAGDQVDLEVVKSSAPDVVVPGETLVYLIEVGNAGPLHVTAARLSDALDPARFDVGQVTWHCERLAGTGLNTGCPWAGDANDLVAGVPISIEPGESVLFTVHAPLRITAAGTVINTASAAVPAGVTELYPPDNSDDETDSLAAPGSCGFPDDLQLTHRTIDGVAEFTACVSLAAGTEFVVQVGGDVSLRAGQMVVLNSGFVVHNGASVLVINDESLG